MFYTFRLAQLFFSAFGELGRENGKKKGGESSRACFARTNAKGKGAAPFPAGAHTRDSFPLLT